MRNNKLAIIVPCYNEEDGIKYTADQLLLVLNNMIDDSLISQNSKICFVNDGSSDKTKDVLENYCADFPSIALVNLIRNYGQQHAILAGLYTVDADMYVTIDADLQDNPLLIINMVKKYLEGYEIVYGCRKKRKTDSFFKRGSAFLFYKFMKLIGVNIRQNHSEFRLMSRFAVEKLKEYKEKTLFLRGCVQNLGLKSCDIFYDGLERLVGKTKYSFFKLLDLAWTAITSFSIFPLRLITFIGILTSFLSAAVIIYAFVSYAEHFSVPGWASIIVTIAFFSGIIIMSIGVIGEYVGKILIEVKARPMYQIDDTLNL